EEFQVPMRMVNGKWETEPLFVGLELDLLSRVMANDQIRVDCRWNLSQKDQSNAVKFQGKSLPGLTTRRFQVQLLMSSGETAAVGQIGVAADESSVTILEPEP